MRQSVRANRAVEAANKLAQHNVIVSEKALALSQQIESFKSELTLKAAISREFPPILTLIPVSSEFVISASDLSYDDEGSHLGFEAITPGVHDISEIAQQIDQELSEHKPRVYKGDGFETMEMGMGYYPFVIHVEYLYQGRSLESRFLYEVYYDEFTYNDRRPRHKGYAPVRKPRLVRKLNESEDTGTVLSERLKEWRVDHFAN